MRIAIPVTHSDQLGRAFDTAARMAIAVVSDGVVQDWKVFDVAWDENPGRSTPAHDKVVADFLTTHDVERVIFREMPERLVKKLGDANLTLMQCDAGHARELCRASSKFAA